MIKSLMILTISVLLWTQETVAQIDAMELALRQPYQTQHSVLWKSITQASILNGIKPEYNAQWKMHVIQLTSGQQSSFYLPANKSIRLHNPEKKLQNQSITVYLSGGSGLLAAAKIQASADGHSLIINPHATKPQLVSIRHSGLDTKTIALAAMVSQYQPLKNIAPYRELNALSGDWVWLSKKPFHAPEIYWKLQTQKTEFVDVVGPSRVVIKNHLRYGSHVNELLQNYAIRYQLGDDKPVWVDFSTGVESSKSITVNTQPETLGREQKAFIEIPAGQHRLHLFSDSHLYLQVIGQDQNDYLFPRLNAPPLTVNEVRAQGLMNAQAVPEANVTAQKMARDNRHQPSALSAHQLLKQAALQRMDYPSAMKEANKLLGQHTFYRNLLPTIKQSQGAQFTAYFINKRLKAIHQPKDDAIVSEQHQSAALKRLGHASFSPLGPGTSDRYLLSKRYAPSLLRVIVDKRACQTQPIKIQMDQQPPQSFILNCQERVNSDGAFVQSVAETALLALPNQKKDKTLSHEFSAIDSPASLIPVAINEILLPTEIQQLKVWSEEGNNYPPINLALQIRVAKPFQFSEQNYLIRIDDFSKANLFKQFTNETKLTQRHKQQLQNEWIPLKRLLNKHYRHFKSSVATKITAKYSVNQALLQFWKKQAKQAEKQQQWPEALSSWNKIVNGSDGLFRDQAQLAQASILSNLSENYLAQRLWRYLLLYAQEEVAEQAEQRLRSFYAQHNDKEALQVLAAASFIHTPNQNSLHFLTEALIDNQHYRFGLLLGLMDNKPTIKLLLKAAYKLQWWRNYQQLLTQLPITQQWFWIGLKAQKNGDYAAALYSWKKAGAGHWSAQLQKGLEIRQQLSKNQNYKQLYTNWSRWQQMQAGEKVWQDASSYIKDAAGTDQYYSVERALHSKAYRGTHSRPVSIHIMGPATLKFNVRILHDSPSTEKNGWLQINDNQMNYRYPFNHNKVTQGLSLIGAGDYSPGNLVTLEYQVGSGFHQIAISSNDTPISMTVNEQRPEFPLSILAPLRINTFLHALSSPDITANQLKNIIPIAPSNSLAITDKDLSLASLLKLPMVNTTRQAGIRMTKYLAVTEQDQKSRKPLLYFAEQLQQKFPNDKAVQAMWGRISAYGQWQPVHSIVSSAGMRFIDTQGWQPSSAKLTTRKALLASSSVNEHVVLAKQRLLVMMSNLAARIIHIDVLLDDVHFLPDSPAQWQYQVDDQAPQQFKITRGEGWKKMSLSIPAGQHQLRFSMINPIANHFLKLRFQDNISDMSVSQEKSFLVSTRLEPLQINIKGPALLRIDEWLNGKITPRFQHIAQGWQFLTISPSNKQKESLLKIWQRESTNKTSAPIIRTVTRKLVQVPPSIISFDKQTPTLPVIPSNQFQLDQQSFGTWSINTDLVSQNNNEEDVRQAIADQFQEFRLEHRYFDALSDKYWKSEGFIRARKYGKPSFGVKESLLILPDTWPFSVNAEAKFIMQEVDNSMEWLGQFKLALSQTARLTPKLKIIPKLSGFGRYMSLRDSEKVFGRGSFREPELISDVDQDIYTVYKSQHRTGLTASLLMIHDPWLDTRWTAKFKSTSNENMNFFKPDNFSTEAHWQQLFGNISLDTSYRVNFYQKDNDRLQTSIRQYTKLALNWQTWTHQQSRFEINAKYNYDIDNSAHSGMLSFSYHFSDGNGYWDFKPGEIDFRTLRERQRLD